MRSKTISGETLISLKTIGAVGVFFLGCLLGLAKAVYTETVSIESRLAHLEADMSVVKAQRAER